MEQLLNELSIEKMYLVAFLGHTDATGTTLKCVWSNPVFLQCIHIEDCEGWWLSSCRGSVAEHWWLKSEVSWFNSQQLLAFSLSSTFASKRLNSFIEPKLHQASLVSCPSARASRRKTVWLMSRISWAYSPERWKTNEIVRLLIIT